MSGYPHPARSSGIDHAGAGWVGCYSWQVSVGAVSYRIIRNTGLRIENKNSYCFLLVKINKSMPIDWRLYGSMHS